MQMLQIVVFAIDENKILYQLFLLKLYILLSPYFRFRVVILTTFQNIPDTKVGDKTQARFYASYLYTSQVYTTSNK